MDALHAGKNVMCEKPMAINPAEAQKMLDAAKETGKILTIGYQGRYRPDSQYLKKECEAGELGDIYYAQAPTPSVAALCPPGACSSTSMSRAAVP